MCEPTTLAIASLVLTAAGTGAAYVQGQQQQAQQKNASRKANENAKSSLAQQEQEMNRRNAKQPNVAALTADNNNAASLGNTLLSGVGGVDPSQLTLGKNTVLGR